MTNREQVTQRAARLFGPEQLADMLAVLDTCGVPEGDGDEWEAERCRVKMAILRLCDTGRGGDAERLASGVKAALTDYRDVLMGAEYSRQGSLPFDAAQNDPAGYAAAVAADRHEYVAWRDGK